MSPDRRASPRLPSPEQVPWVLCADARPQKEAWSTAIAILQAPAEPDVQLFAATTLKGKVGGAGIQTVRGQGGVRRMLTTAQITYDLSSQLPEADLPALRSQLLALLGQFAPGPKPVRIQLCVCLAVLAIQMLSWKDVLPTVVSSLGNDVASHSCILDFLRVLPEEVTEGRKITLSVRRTKAMMPTSPHLSTRQAGIRV